MKDNNKLNWYKRFIAIALCAFVSFAYMPLMAYAESNLSLAKAIEVEPETNTGIGSTKETLASGDDLLEQFFDVQVKKGLSKKSFGLKAQRNTRGSKLTGKEKVVYDYLKAKIEDIAAGKSEDPWIYIPLAYIIDPDNPDTPLSFTADQLGVESIIVNGDISQDAVDAFSDMVDYDASAVVDALLYDLPYDFYWFDKTSSYLYGGDYSFSASWDYDAEECKLYIECGDSEEPSSYFAFSVSNAYKKEGTDQIIEYLPNKYFTYSLLDTDKTGATVTAATNAGNIISENADKTDYEKLVAYKQCICDLTDYNFEAIEPEYDGGYGDPWQMIWVFDGDADTRVVCEGYSKAMQYLCDNSSFSDDSIECHSVSGKMDGGDHMWNILHMDDNCCYIADITNCDSGVRINGQGQEVQYMSIGYPDKLFLKGALAGGSVQDGYMYDCDGDGDGDVTYIYDGDTTSLFATEELTMSTSVYVPCQHNWQSTGVTKQASCTEAGAEGFECSKCHATKSETIAALGHDFTVVVPNSAVAPTCTEAGKEANKKCSRCDEVEIGATIAALGHKYETWTYLNESEHQSVCENDSTHKTVAAHTWDNGVVTTPATDTEDGEKTFTCSVCRGTKTETIYSKLSIAKANAKAELAKVDVSKYSGAERTAVEKAIREALEKIDGATSVEEVISAKNAAVSTVNAQKTDAKKAEEAAAKRAADREGTVGAGMPKVKLKKLTAKKNKITIKWTKLTTKQLKKSKATSYEIWVSTSNKYPEGATTKEKILKKGKSSWTCTGLKKNTKYFVKIRAIKYVNGAKVTGKWKQKTIKTKKK